MPAVLDLVRKVRRKGVVETARTAIEMLVAKETTILLVKDLARVDQVEPHVDVEFRWLTQGDIEPFMQARRASNAADVGDFFARGARCLGAFVDGRLAGYMWFLYDYCRFAFFDYDLVMKPGEAFLGPALVDDAHRGRGIYPALLTRAFAALKEQGYRVAMGAVGTGNQPSIRGIVRAGYSPQRSITAVRLLNRFVVYMGDAPCTRFTDV